MKISIKVIYFFIAFTFISCQDKDDYQPIIDIDEVLLLTNNTQKAWYVESFKINNIEFVDSLKADTCYQPVWFVKDDNFTMYGYNNSIYCTIHGDWFLENANKIISFNFDATGYIGIGPWSGGKYTKWHIIKFTESELLITVNYLQDNYIIKFNSI